MPISKIQANSLAANAVASAPGKNLIINGAMQVAQRGTSFTSANPAYTLDRFKSRIGTSGVATISQEDFALGQTDLPNFQHFLRHDQTTARTGAFFFLAQHIEDVTRFDNVTLTLSFYAKADAAKTVNISTYQQFGSGGSSDVTITNGQGFSIGTTWQRFTHTFTAPSLSGKTVGAGSCLLIEWREDSFSTFTFDITGVQLEVGGTATDFEHKSYGEELALCQRYYQILTLLNTNYSAAIAYTGGSNAVLPTTNFSTMRAAPTVTFDSSGNIEYYSGSAWTDTTVSAHDTTDNYTVIIATGAGPSGVTRGSLIRTDQGTPMNALLDAEL